MKIFPLPLLFGSALLAGLAIADESPAQQRQQQQQNGQKQKQEQDKAAKEKAAKDKAAAAAGMKFEEGEALRNAYLLLLGANHDYDGHRAKAFKEVKAAFKILDTQIMKAGTPQQKDALKKENATIAEAEKAAAGAPMAHEPQPKSDAQLSMAKGVLTRLRPVLTKANQKDVLGHVQKALAEIDTALKISAAHQGKVGVQFAEAEMLRKAYLLLLEGNADYDGHRGTAMTAVKDAFAALDNYVKAYGTDPQKAQMTKENATIAAAESARQKAGTMQENQVISDALLTGAKETRAQLRPTLVKNKQHKAILDKVDTAMKEIDTALSIR
jgi:hypothetical protein